MKRVIALAAAALLLTAGGALAKATNISYAVDGTTCTATVNVISERSEGITKPVVVTLVNANGDCGTLTGEGLIGKVTVATGDTRTLAIIGGTTQLLPYSVTITLDYPLVTGGQFTISYTADGKKITNAASGTYTVD
jgi:hypothetical protein